jgi:hypothetical protein
MTTSLGVRNPNSRIAFTEFKFSKINYHTLCIIVVPIATHCNTNLYETTLLLIKIV